MLSATLPFLPRVRRGRAVLSVARWRLEAQEPAALAAEFQQWRDRWGVPRQVYLAAGDHRLLLNLADRAHWSIIENELRRSGVAYLQEALPGLDSAWLPGSDNGRLLSWWSPSNSVGPPPRPPILRNNTPAHRGTTRDSIPTDYGCLEATGST